MMEAHPRENPESGPRTDIAVTADVNQLEIPSIVVQTGLSPPNSPRNQSPPDSCSTRQNCPPRDSAAVELAGSDDRRGFRVQQQDRDHHQKSTGGLGRLVSSSSFNAGSNRSPSPKVQRSKSFKHQRTLAKQRGVSEDAEWTWDPLPDCNEDPQTSTAGENDDDKSFPTAAAGRIERPGNIKMRNGVACGGGRGSGRTMTPSPSSGGTMLTRTRSLDYPNFCVECRSSSPSSAAGRGGGSSSNAAARLDCGSPGCRNYSATIRTNSSNATRNCGASTYSRAAAEGSSRRNGHLLRHSESALADEPLPSENKGGAGSSFVGPNEEPYDELDPTTGRQHRQLHSPLLSARIRHPEQQRESSPSPSNRSTSSRSFPSPPSTSTSTSARAPVGPGGASRWAEPAAAGPPSAAQQSSNRTTANVAAGGSKTLRQRNSKVRLLVRSEAMREATSPPPEVNFPPLPLPALACSPIIGGGGASVCSSSSSSAPPASKQQQQQQHRRSVSPCSPALDDGNKSQQQVVLLSSSSISTSLVAQQATTDNGTTSNPGSNNKPPAPSLGGSTSRRYKFRQQGSSQSAGSMTSVDESPPPLSRDDSVEQYKDFAGMSSGELENFIVETLHRSPKDRMTLLKIESDLVSFAKDETRTSFKFPAMSSYQRMLVHRVAAYFGMAHNVDAAGTCVVVERTRSTRTPGMKFRDQIRPDVAWTCPFPQQQQHHLSETTRRSILKKDSSSFEEYKSSSSGELLDSPLRYWGSSSAESTGGAAGGAGPAGAISKSHPWSSSTESSDGIMAPPLLHSSSARRGSRPPARALKVQSFDSESLLALPERRPGMAKANSFGGYSGSTGTGDQPYSTSSSATAGNNQQHGGGGRGHILMRGPFSRGDSVSSTHSASARLVSKQDSVSSSTASYLSASSSGYKSCRGSSFETRTPSPGVGGFYYLSVNAQTQTHSLQSSQGPSPDIPDSVQVESGGPIVDIMSSCSIDHDSRRHIPNRHVTGEEEDDDDDEYEPEVARAMGLPCPSASPVRADGESGHSPSSTVAVMEATAPASSCRNQHQESAMTSTAVLWALSSMEDVPSGAILINPQTGKPLINPDGSIYRFNRSNPPQIVAPNPSASSIAAGAYCRVRQHHHEQGSSLQLPAISHVMSATGVVRPHVATAVNLASYAAHHQLLGPADGAHQHVQSAQGPHHGAFHDLSSAGPLQVRPVSPSTSAGSSYTVASSNGHQPPALRHPLGCCTTAPSQQQQHHFGLQTAAQQFSDEVTTDSGGDFGSPAMAAGASIAAHTHQLPRYLSHQQHHYSPPEAVAAAAAGIGNLYRALALGMGGAGDAASSPDEYAARAAHPSSSSSGTASMGGQQQQGPFAAEASWGDENHESPSSGLGALPTPAAAALTVAGSSACGGSNGNGSIPYNNYECLGMDDESYRSGEREGGLAQQGIATVPAGSSATTSPYAVMEVPTMYGASAGASIYAPANAGLIIAGKPVNDNCGASAVSVSAAVFPSSSFFPSQHHPSAPVSKTPMSVSSALAAAGSRQTNDDRGPPEVPGCWMASAVVRENVEDLATRACQTPPATALVTSEHLEFTQHQQQQQQHLVHASIAAQHSSLNPAASAFVAASGHHQQQYHPNSAYFHHHHHQFHQPHPADILTSPVNSGPGFLVPSYPSNNNGQQHIHHQQAMAMAMAGAQHQHQHQPHLGVTQSNVNPQLTAAVAVVSPTPAASGLPHAAGAVGQFQQVAAAGSGLHHAAVLLGSAAGPVPQCVGGLHRAYRLPHLPGPGHPAVEATMLHSPGVAAGYVHQQLIQHQQAHHHGFLPATGFSPFLLRGHSPHGSHQQQYTGQLHHQHHHHQHQQAQHRGPRFGGGGSSSAMSPRIPRGSSFHHGMLGSGGSNSVTTGAREHFANRSASFTATDTSRRCENPRLSDDGDRRRKPDHAGQGDDEAGVGGAGHQRPAARATPDSTQSPSASPLIHTAVPHRPLSALQQQPRSEGSDMDLIASEKPSDNPPVATGSAEGDRHD